MARFKAVAEVRFMKSIMTMAWIRWIGSLGLILMLSNQVLGAEADTARQLLLQALENQYRGPFQASIELVDESFPHGKDSLSGQLDFADEVGQRRICLAGNGQSFEYRSLHFGKEQWLTDETSHRIRRIANRQWKKGVFGNLLTFEDMLKMPGDFLLDYSTCRNFKVTDSSYEITVELKPVFQSVYSYVDVCLAKNPLLLRRLVFYGNTEKKLKTLTIREYQPKDGKFLFTDVAMSDCDSLSTLHLSLHNFSFADSEMALKVRSKPDGLSLLIPKSASATNQTPTMVGSGKADGAPPREGDSESTEEPEDATN